MNLGTLTYLRDLCEREVNRCGLDTDAGRRSKRAMEEIQDHLRDATEKVEPPNA